MFGAAGVLVRLSMARLKMPTFMMAPLIFPPEKKWRRSPSDERV